MNTNTITFLESYVDILRTKFKGDSLYNADEYTFRYCREHTEDMLNILVADIQSNIDGYAERFELHPDRIKALASRITNHQKLYHRLQLLREGE